MSAGKPHSAFSSVALRPFHIFLPVNMAWKCNHQPPTPSFTPSGTRVSSRPLSDFWMTYSIPDEGYDFCFLHFSQRCKRRERIISVSQVGYFFKKYRNQPFLWGFYFSSFSVLCVSVFIFFAKLIPCVWRNIFFLTGYSCLLWRTWVKV